MSIQLRKSKPPCPHATPPDAHICDHDNLNNDHCGLPLNLANVEMFHYYLKYFFINMLFTKESLILYVI